MNIVHHSPAFETITPCGIAHDDDALITGSLKKVTCPRCGDDTRENNNENEDDTMENDQPLSGHVIDYQNTEETNNVSYMVLGAVMEYLTDYASLENGATYDEVKTALDTLDENFFGSYTDYREVVEAMLEAQGADPIPDWLAIDYKTTWESDLRHMLEKVGDEYNNGNGYYFSEH